MAIPTRGASAANLDAFASVESLTLGLGAVGRTITGDAGDNLLAGGAGNDTLDGGNDGFDTLAGGLGNDTYLVTGNGLDVIVEAAEAGIDTVLTDESVYELDANVENFRFLEGSDGLLVSGNALANLITGNSNDNVLFGEAGNDTLDGGAGRDVFDGGTGADAMRGGLGDDTYVIDDVHDVVTEAANQGSDTVFSTVSLTLGANLENLTLGGTTATNGTGNGLANQIFGNAAANLLAGAAGNDTLTGGGGSDTLAGGSGDDVYRLTDSADVISEMANQGIDRVESSVTTSLGANLENLALTGTAAIDGIGNALANAITGNSAGNHLIGGSGNDTLDGGNGGLDLLAGGLGNDTYLVTGNGSDVIIETAGEGVDTVVTDRLFYELDANVENFRFLEESGGLLAAGNALANLVVGNSHDNKLFGEAGNDTLDGGAGDDLLGGGAGADAMRGGLGNDVYDVDDIHDGVTEAANQGSDTVFSTVSFTLGANLEDLNLHGTAAINGAGNGLANQIFGSDSANLLTGAADNDTLVGGAGSDTLVGGVGNDLIAGGAGADSIDAAGGHDTLRYESVLDAGDVIQHFGSSGAEQDMVDLDALFDSLAVAAADRAARVSLVDAGPDVQLRIDTDGGGGADLLLLTFHGVSDPGVLSIGNGAAADIQVGG